MKKIFSLLNTLAFSLLSAGANAQEKTDSGLGVAKPWQLNFQEAATPVMERLVTMHNWLLYLIVFISLFVLAVMVLICIKFNRRANPIPSKTTHNTLLEVIWTTIPIIILIIIAIPSLRLHYYMQRPVDPEMTLKVVGYQWYWHYEYPDQGGFGFDSYMKKGADLKEGDIRLLAVDNRLVVPVDTTIRVLVTGGDVIHAFAIPSFGVKRDGVPGRLNETWFKAQKTGTYYGQCSELCGVGHGFMPIVVDVVSKEDFKAWSEKKRQESGILSPAKTNDTKEEKKEAKKEDKKTTKSAK